MSITDTIAAACVQTAVYWGNPVPDGYGSFTFDTPVEIACRWEDRTGTFMSNKGEQIFSKAHVFTTQDVDERGWIYLGELTDLDSDPDDPKIIDNAYEIKRFDKSPSLQSTTEFVRKSYL